MRRLHELVADADPQLSVEANAYPDPASLIPVDRMVSAKEIPRA
jgi:hypothetical protein